MPASSSDAIARLERLKSYLAVDPDNCALMSDAAEAALAAHRYQEVNRILERRASLAPPGLRERSLSGLAAMGAGDFRAAVDIFTPLQGETKDDPSLRFNLAWSLSKLEDDERALSLLDDATVIALPQAAMLQVQLLHRRERLDEAADAARRLITIHSDHQGLLAAASVVAIDAEDRDLAAATAARAGDHPDALTTLGMLALDGEDLPTALSYFDRVLAQAPEAPRALLGRGLGRLVGGDLAQGARDLEECAQRFDTHIGSWIAAGWARLVLNDLPLARAHFERALAIDAAFAETQGSLAVVTLLEGDFNTAQMLAQKASRLDRRSFSATLAHALLANSKGQADVARALIERAFQTQIDSSGKTLAHSLAKFGLFT